MTPEKAIEIIKNLNFRATGETKQANEMAIEALTENKKFKAKQNPLRFKTEHICPACNAHNETIKRRMATVKRDVCYCWYCGQAIEFGGDGNERG